MGIDQPNRLFARSGLNCIGVCNASNAIGRSLNG
jgi:hypothetical protein